MNKLVLIGNGFDLAHGLKTSYLSFITNLLIDGIKTRIFSPDDTLYDKMIEVTNHRYRLSDEGGPGSIEEIVKDTLTRDLLTELRAGNYPFNMTCKSSLLGQILTSARHANWVDIELEYYKNLLIRIKTPQSSFPGPQSQVRNLNIQMADILFHLNKYIGSLPPAINIPEIQSIIDDNETTALVKGRPKLASSYMKILLLNFNYTSTARMYARGSTSLINIHGTVNDDKYPPIFGFGDEKDRNYQLLDEFETNDSLDFVKSFHYSKSTEYDDLLNFIQTPYVIEIMGHSCGLSDRTLLAMLFENQNCQAIRVFYHGDEKKNNHFGVLQNISRHFTSKQDFRNKVVFLPHSTRLPQYDD